MNLLKQEIFDDLPAQSFIDSVANVLPGPLFVIDENDLILACNAEALKAASATDFEALIEKGDGRLSALFLKQDGYFVPNEKKWVLSLGERTPLVALSTTKKHSHDFRLRASLLPSSKQRMALVYLEDIETIQRAKKAERYFETFKQQFLTSISHEFRTPMNSIIGFAGLLEQSIGDSAQNKEYVETIQKSAGMMLENIENLLDLMQIESGLHKSKKETVKLNDELESFFQRFCQRASDKGVSIYYLIDPALPSQLLADIDAIQKILRNLISNALKFTARGGQVLVEIKVLRAGKKTEVRYSVTDSGAGIEKHRLHTILRPFAASRENLLQGKEGFGVGLTLAFKLLKMLRSELSVASEVGKGSRFSFVLKHVSIEASSFAQTYTGKIALWCDREQDKVQLKILQKYLRWFGAETVEIDTLYSDTLRDANTLFVLLRDTANHDIQKLQERFPTLRIIAITANTVEKQQEFDRKIFDDVIRLPLLPKGVEHALYNIAHPDLAKNVTQEQKSAEVRTENTNREILVAEDNVINQKLIVKILEQEGYAVETADNGKIAVKAYNDHRFDLILMDIDMPVMDGISATHAIKEIEKSKHWLHTPIIALTARALAGDRERIIGAGLDAYLTKPVDREFLLDTIEQYIALKDARNKQIS